MTSFKKNNSEFLHLNAVVWSFCNFLPVHGSVLKALLLSTVLENSNIIDIVLKIIIYFTWTWQYQELVLWLFTAF